MVDGYITPDEAKRTREQRAREIQAAREAILDNALDELRSAVERLRQSTIPPDCVIEVLIKKRLGFLLGHELVWDPRSPAWFLGWASRDAPDFLRYSGTAALDVHGKFFENANHPGNIGGRKQFMGNPMANDEVRVRSADLLARVRHVLNEPHDWSLYTDAMR